MVTDRVTADDVQFYLPEKQLKHWYLCQWGGDQCVVEQNDQKIVASAALARGRGRHCAWR